MRIGHKLKLTEDDMVTGVVSWLNSNGYYAWRQENVGRFDQDRCLVWLRRYFDRPEAPAFSEVSNIIRRCWTPVPEGVRGVADIIGWHIETGRWVAVEIKVGKDHLSQFQQNWLSGCKEAGGEVYVARTMADFIKAWRKRNPPTNPPP